MQNNVEIGSQVVYRNLESKKEIEVLIVENDANNSIKIASNCKVINYTTPVAKALLGNQLGNIITVKAPNPYIIKILEIKENRKRIANKLLKKLEENGFEGFHHYTDFCNFINIFKEKKLYCRELIMSSNFVDAAEASIISQTSKKVLKSVRFYYKEKTPTLYRNEGIKKNPDIDIYNAHMPIPVLLLFHENIIYHEGVEFSNGCCGKRDPKITNVINEALDFNWKGIFKRGSYNIPSEIVGEEREKEKDNIKNARNAEFLYPKEISLDYLKNIFFRCPADKKHAEFIFGPENIFKVNPKKFNIENGIIENRNYLYDYHIVNDQDFYDIEFIYDNDPSGYSHNLKLFYKNDKIDIIKLTPTKKIFNFCIPKNQAIDRIEYSMNNIVSAVWR